MKHLCQSRYSVLGIVNSKYFRYTLRDPNIRARWIYVSCCSLCLTSLVKNMDSKLLKVTPRDMMFPPIITVKGAEGSVPVLLSAALTSLSLFITTTLLRSQFERIYFTRSLAFSAYMATLRFQIFL